jgi:CyaY protein
VDESNFNHLAEETMAAIEEAIEASGVDIDYDNIADILTLEFPNRSRVIINKQTPLTQIWVAAKSGGYHFDFDEKSRTWCLNTNPEKELFTQLSLYCSEQLGEPVELNSNI